MCILLFTYQLNIYIPNILYFSFSNINLLFYDYKNSISMKMKLIKIHSKIKICANI